MEEVHLLGDGQVLQGPPTSIASRRNLAKERYTATLTRGLNPYSRRPCRNDSTSADSAGADGRQHRRGPAVRAFSIDRWSLSIQSAGSRSGRRSPRGTIGLAESSALAGALPRAAALATALLDLAGSVAVLSTRRRGPDARAVRTVWRRDAATPLPGRTVDCRALTPWCPARAARASGPRTRGDSGWVSAGSEGTRRCPALHLQVAAHHDRALRRQVEHAGAVGGVAGEPEEQGAPPPRQRGDVSTSEPQRR